MKVSTWNARGLNASSKQRLLRQNLKAFESKIVMLQETKLNSEEGLKLGKKTEVLELPLSGIMRSFRRFGIYMESEEGKP